MIQIIMSVLLTIALSVGIVGFRESWMGQKYWEGSDFHQIKNALMIPTSWKLNIIKKCWIFMLQEGDKIMQMTGNISRKEKVLWISMWKFTGRYQLWKDIFEGGGDAWRLFNFIKWKNHMHSRILQTKISSQKYVLVHEFSSRFLLAEETWWCIFTSGKYCNEYKVYTGMEFVSISRIFNWNSTTTKAIPLKLLKVYEVLDGK